jgi:hypothetical protein
MIQDHESDLLPPPFRFQPPKKVSLKIEQIS